MASEPRIAPRHHDCCATVYEGSWDCTCGLDAMQRVVDASMAFWAGIEYGDWPKPEERQAVLDACRAYHDRRKAAPDVG